MTLEPIRQDELAAQLKVLVEKSEWPINVDQIAFALARFAEARVINDGNRQIEVLQKSPRELRMPAPAERAPGDMAKSFAELRAAHFRFFLWLLPVLPGKVVVEYADEATARVVAMLDPAKEQL